MTAPRRAFAVVAGMLLLAGCAVGHPRASRSPSVSAPGTPSTSSASPPPSSPTVATISIAGKVIPAVGIPDVAAAIVAAGVSVPDGRLLAVVSGRVLDAHAAAAGITVNGEPATTATRLRPGDVVILVPAPDRIEANRTVTAPVYLDAAAAALYVDYRPGTSRDVEGVVSGEVVESTLLATPVVGRLRAPARLSLTFDDGPNPSATPEVLGLLARYHVPAVFCLIGANAATAAVLVRQEVAAGHRLCDHTQTHPLNLPDLSARRIAAEIRAGYDSILRAGGVAPGYFRAPGGNWSPTVEADARALHLTALRWTVDPRDWSRPGTPTIVLRVLNQLRPDGIVLLHDGGGDRSQTVAALEQLLGQLSAAGWSASFPGWVR